MASIDGLPALMGQTSLMDVQIPFPDRARLPRPGPS